jgi:hypothetical protein
MSSQLCSSATERAPVPRAAPAALAGAVSGVQLSQSAAPAAAAVIYKQRIYDALAYRAIMRARRRRRRRRARAGLSSY